MHMAQTKFCKWINRYPLKTKTQKTTTMKNKTEFKELCESNDGSDTIEIETTIEDESCSIFYFKERDEVLVVYWCEWFEDEIKFLKTSYFDSFKDAIIENEQLLYFTDNYDYGTESHYTEYYSESFSEWIENEGHLHIKDFVLNQIQIHGSEYIKRTIKSRIKRWLKKTNYKIKNLFK